MTPSGALLQWFANGCRRDDPALKQVGATVYVCATFVRLRWRDVSLYAWNDGPCDWGGPGASGLPSFTKGSLPSIPSGRLARITGEAQS